jgi:hypothetical protein
LLVAGAASCGEAKAEASPMNTLRTFTISLLHRIAPDLADQPITIGHASELAWIGTGDSCDGFTGPGTSMALGVSGAAAIVINDREISDYYRVFKPRRRDTDFAIHYIGVALHEIGHVLSGEVGYWAKWFPSQPAAQAACRSTINGEDRAALPEKVSDLVELVHHQPKWIRACVHLHARARIVGGLLGLSLSRIITQNHGGVPGWAIRSSLGNEVLDRLAEPIGAILDSAPPPQWTENIVRPFAATFQKALEPLSQDDRRRVVRIVSGELRQLLEI